MSTNPGVEGAAAAIETPGWGARPVYCSMRPLIFVKKVPTSARLSMHMMRAMGAEARRAKYLQHIALRL
jgi:hypothetical protein